MTKNKLLLNFWGYASEHIACVLLPAFAHLVFSFDSLLSGLPSVAPRLSLVSTTLLAGSLAFLSVFFGQLSSKFGKYIAVEGFAPAVSYALTTAIAYHALSALSLIITSGAQHAIAGIAALYFLVLSMLNLLSTVSNLHHLVRLRVKFEAIMRRIDS